MLSHFITKLSATDAEVEINDMVMEDTMYKYWSEDVCSSIKDVYRLSIVAGLSKIEDKLTYIINKVAKAGK